MPRSVEFFFDFTSPYSYLASTRVEAMAASAGATVRWRPVYLPGLMRATGNRGPAEVGAKALYMLKDLNDWATLLGLPPVRLPDDFPFSAAHADRVALVVDELERAAPGAAPMLPRFARQLFRRVWVDGLNPNGREVLEPLLRELGLDAAAVIEKASTDELKARLRQQTDDVVARGAFGVPTFFVDDELFVGNDRLDFVERALRRPEE